MNLEVEKKIQECCLCKFNASNSGSASTAFWRVTGTVIAVGVRQVAIPSMNEEFFHKRSFIHFFVNCLKDPVAVEIKVFF